MKRYDKQALLLAEKLKEATIFELNEAHKKGELQFIKSDDIEHVAEIVYLYYSVANRPYGGGFRQADINLVIQESLTMYAKVKLGYRVKGESEDEEWNKFISDSSNEFARKIDNIDAPEELKQLFVNKPFANYDGSPYKELCIDELVYPITNRIYVQSPVYKFAYVGNNGSFSMAKENEDGLPVRQQFMDNGVILPEPIETYYYDGTWHTELPTMKK